MFYKINVNDTADAKNNQPLKLVAHVEDDLYYHTLEEELQPPFIKVDEKDVPFGVGLDLSPERNMLLDRAQSKLHFDFTSDALGEEHKYDLHTEQDQLNLTQALLYMWMNSGMMKSSPSVNIRCIDKNGVKDNRPHTKKQLEKLFSDWYVYKSTILDKYSTLKINITTNNPLELSKLEEEHQ